MSNVCPEVRLEKKKKETLKNFLQEPRVSFHVEFVFENNFQEWALNAFNTPPPPS